MMPWLVHTLVSTTLLMLLVLASRRPVAQAFGARVAYALWLLPALRMILPPLPGGHQLYVPVLRIDPAAPVRVGLMPPGLPGDRLALPPELARAFDPLPHAAAWGWSGLLLAAWLGGAALWFGWQLLRYRRFVDRALDGATPLGTECRVDVLLSDHVGGPVASGVLRRRIFLPRDFVARYTSAERRQALLHEGAHHDRHDLLANIAGLAVLALHWWNPIAHIAHRAFRSDQELACDATVLAQADPADCHAYGSALVKSACARTPAAACALDPATEIKRRLHMITRARLPLPFRAAGALLAAAAIGGGLFATASSGAPTPIGREFTPPLAAIEPPVEPIAPPAPMGAPAPLPALPPKWAGHAHRSMMHDPALPPEEAAQRAGEQARQAGEEARIAGEYAGEQARRAGEQARIAGEYARRASADQARASMFAACAARGRPVRPDERDWSELALCGKAAFHAEIQAAIAAAREGGHPPHVPYAPYAPAPPFPPVR